RSEREAEGVMTVFVPFLSVGPRIHKEEGKLIACTGWRTRIETLGMLYRQVVVDPGKEQVTIRRRYLWCLRRGWRIPLALGGGGHLRLRGPRGRVVGVGPPQPRRLLRGSAPARPAGVPPAHLRRPGDVQQ